MEKEKGYVNDDIIASPLQKCNTTRGSAQALACTLEGALVRDKSCFPYFFLVALEAGSLSRAILLLLLYPLACLIGRACREDCALALLCFVSTSGLKIKDIESASKAVLPRFYADDVHAGTFRVFSSFPSRHVVTSGPRLFVEHFCMAYVGASSVIGTELQSTPFGTATGFLKPPAMTHVIATLKVFPNIGIVSDTVRGCHPLFVSCKEKYIVRDASKAEALPREKLVKPLVFHDGRLVQRPTPLTALVTLLWLPIGFPLAVSRVLCGLIIPAQYSALYFRLTGTRLIVKGKPPSPGTGSISDEEGFLFVCSHRTLLDPIMVTVALGRKVAALSYSISRLSEFISPIKIIPLSRDRLSDADRIRTQLRSSDVVICPEGTTCREPYLLRFSSLFAELSDRIVPVAMHTHVSMFHGSTVRGFKAMDAFFFFMNPSPVYEVTFLEQLSPEVMSARGGHDVANHIQRLLAERLGFTCTTLTRKDKYSFLIGSDGSVPTTTPTT